MGFDLSAGEVGGAENPGSGCDGVTDYAAGITGAVDSLVVLAGQPAPGENLPVWCDTSGKLRRMTFDPVAVAHAYAAGAQEYAAKFAEDLANSAFDCSVLSDATSTLATPSVILDVGSGPGQVSAFVSQQGHRPLAVDLALEMLHVARTRLPIDAVRADVCHLPVVAGAANAAICWYSLHHLTRTLMPGVLGELRRTLARAGRLAIATHAGSGEEWHDVDSRGITEQVVVTYYRADELVDLVNAAGFEVLDVRTRDPLPHEHQVTKLYVTATTHP